METDGSFLETDLDIARVAQPSDRRPDFCAEALSPGVRIGLLGALMVAIGFLFVSVFAMGVYPRGILDFGGNSIYGVMLVGTTMGLAFFMQLVFGALLGNNPRLTKFERITWYTMFAFAGPIALPTYWLIEVWPIPFQPSAEQRL